MRDDRHFVEDVMSCVGNRPVLLNDVVSKLRHAECASKHRWTNVRVQDVEEILRARGITLRYRPHGAGIAVYAAAAPFSQVETRYGWKPVRPYRPGEIPG